MGRKMGIRRVIADHLHEYGFALTALLIVITTATFFIYRHRQGNLIGEATSKLITLGNTRREELQAHVMRQMKEATQLARHPQAKQAISELPQAPLIKLFQPYLSSLNVKDVLFIAANGTVALSLSTQNIVQTNILQSPYSDTELGRSFSRVMMSLSADISRYDYYPAIEGPALFVIAPIINHEKLHGAVALQLHDEEIIKKLGSYQDLGSSGEAIVGNLSEEIITLLTTRRHLHLLPQAASKFVTLRSTQEIPLQKATLGSSGSGSYYDYRNKKTITSWQFIRNVEWGMLVKQDVSEIIGSLQPLYNTIWVFLVLAALFFLASLFIAIRKIIRRRLANQALKVMPFRWKINIAKTIMGCCFALFALSSLVLFQYYRNIIQTAQQDARHFAKGSVIGATRDMHEQLRSVEAIAHTIPNDLASGRLTLEELPVRLQRDLKENDHVIAISVAIQPVDQATTLIAPRFVKTPSGIKQESVTDFYNYTRPGTPEEPAVRWYQYGMLSRSGWLDPHEDPINPASNAMYVAPFHLPGTKRGGLPSGVILIQYDLEAIKTLVDEISIGETGYAFIIDGRGHFIMHPTEAYVLERKTIFSLATELNNQALATIGNDAKKGRSGFIRYENEITSQTSWTYYQPIGASQWTLCLVYIEEEIPLPTTKLWRIKLWILITTLLALIALILILTRSYYGTRQNLLRFSVFSTITLLIGLSVLWQFIGEQITLISPDELIVVDKVGLNKFLDELTQSAKQEHEEPPTAIPTGIFIYDLNYPDPNHIAFTGYVWQQYDKEIHKDIPRGIAFPQATEDMTITQAYTASKDGVEGIGWRTRGILTQRTNYANYPFDIQHIEILIAHKDMPQNVILIPDLDAYPLINPSAKPGIHRKFTLDEFIIQKSFFSFEAGTIKTDFGLKELERKPPSIHLKFNMLLRRGLLQTFVVFLLPLLIALIAIFSVFSITLKAIHTSPDQPKTAHDAMVAYAALFFSIVILQRSLRAQYPTGQVLYIEYFFFSSYITLLILVVHSIIVASKSATHFINHTLMPIFQVFFWPLQVMTWVATTIVVFYR